LWINVNKKSVVLNLKTHPGVELARQLIARSDVLVENYHVGQMEKFGLGYDALKTINPRLIYACSRGFGETGPYAHYGSTAQTNNSMTGWTHTGWKYSGAPASAWCVESWPRSMPANAAARGNESWCRCRKR
jgi:crotonobetainyl-CoA:carnitine CoA-transferase CaiB-like acyl-CoA transferase